MTNQDGSEIAGLFFVVLLIKLVFWNNKTYLSGLFPKSNVKSKQKADFKFTSFVQQNLLCSS